MISFGSKPQVMTIDIDSTVADTRHRWHMVKDNPNPDWLEYALASGDDKPANIDLIRSIKMEGVDYIFVSSRPEGARSVTLKWLNALDLPYIALVLDDDDMSIGEFKVKALRQISETYEVLCHFDDRKEVKDAVESQLGIRVFVMSAYND